MALWCMEAGVWTNEFLRGQKMGVRHGLSLAGGGMKAQLTDTALMKPPCR